MPSRTRSPRSDLRSAKAADPQETVDALPLRSPVTYRPAVPESRLRSPRTGRGPRPCATMHPPVATGPFCPDPSLPVRDRCPSNAFTPTHAAPQATSLQATSSPDASATHVPDTNTLRTTAASSEHHRRGAINRPPCPRFPQPCGSTEPPCTPHQPGYPSLDLSWLVSETHIARRHPCRSGWALRLPSPLPAGRGPRPCPSMHPPVATGPC
jgi:hypothetical protein